MLRRTRRSLLLLLAGLCVQSSAYAAMAPHGEIRLATRQDRQSSGWDAAAVTLRPGDVAQPGWVHDGAFVERLDSEARNQAAYLGRGTSAESVAVKLTAMGWQRMHVDELTLPSASSPAYPAQRIRSYVTEYSTADGAAAGFTYLEDESTVPSAKDVPATRTFGQESELTLDRGVSALDGRTFRSLDLTFRIGALVAGVTLIVYPSKTVVDPQASVVEALGAILEARVRTPPGDGAGLGHAVARLALVDHKVVSYDDAYLRIGGTDIPVSGESSGATSRRVRTYADATDVYQLWQGIDVPSSAGLLIGVTLLHFPTEAAAAAWVTHLQTILEANPFYSHLRPIDGTPALEDQTIALSYAAGGGAETPRAVLVAVRVGSTVARVHIVPQGRLQDIPAGPAVVLAMVEAGCLSGVACDDILQAPEGLIVTTPAASPAAVRNGGPVTAAATPTGAP
ncbi:MAG: hypothetical protein ACR2OO_01370 [Thermomicrobiales bacterium]